MKLTIREDINDLIDVHDVVECTRWTDGSGFSETQTLDDNIFKDTSTHANMPDYRDYITRNDPRVIEDFYNEYVDGIDYLYKITRTNENDVSDKYEFEFWASELFAEDYAKLSPED